MSAFIVQLCNQAGELDHLARAIRMRGVTILHIAECGSGDQCCALLGTDDEASTAEVLRSMGADYVRGDCVIASVRDRIDPIGDLTGKLRDAGVIVHRSCVVSRGAGSTEVGLAVDDASRAREVLGLARQDAVPVGR